MMPPVNIKHEASWAILPRSALRVALSGLAAVLLPVAAAVAASQGPVEPTLRAAEALPRFTGYVVDQAEVLNGDERHSLTQRLGSFERETRHQLAVVTVKSLGGEDVATFTKRLSNRWGVGQKGINDGIVLLVAPHDRTARIAVGYGLERQLPDAFCQQIMERIMMPAVARGKVGLGVRAGVSAIIERLSTTAANVR
jgi:uncharacterized protein